MFVKDTLIVRNCANTTMCLSRSQWMSQYCQLSRIRLQATDIKNVSELVASPEIQSYDKNGTNLARI